MARSSRLLGSRSDRILVVDDESFIREGIELYFATEGYKVFVAANGEEALAVLGEEGIDVAILDIVMPGMSGIDLLREMKKNYPDVEVIMASGNGTLQTAVEAMRLGAYDYITKPILNFEEDLLKVVQKALERKRLLATNRKLALDLQEVNGELKESNAQLRRRLAELELLGETGGLVSDFDQLDALLDLVEGTLLYQFEIRQSLVLVAGDGGLRLARAPGCGALPDPAPVVPITEQPATDALLAPLGISLDQGEQVRFLPLRACGELIGLLGILHREEIELEDRLQLLTLFAAQISPPLALLREKVAP